MEPIPTSLKFQFVSGSSPTLHDIDQRVSTGKFKGDAESDHHTTFFEIDPITGTIQDFIGRLAGPAKSLIEPLIFAISGINVEEPVLSFLEDHGDALNAQIAKESFQGHSIRIALMDGKEE